MNLDLLLEPQKAHTQFLFDAINKYGRAFDPSPTGTGKTYVASCIAKNLNKPIIVICPRAAKATWRDTLKLFGVTATVIIGYEKLTRGNTPYLKYKKKLYLNGKKPWFEKEGIVIKFPKDAFVIIDEVHKCRNRKSKASEMLVALHMHAMGNPEFKGLVISASAAENSTKMGSFGLFMGLHKGKDFASFARDHGALDDGFGGFKWDKDSPGAKDGMLKIHNTLFNINKTASIMNREDFGDIFPENRIIARSFDLGKEGSAKLQGVYDQMERELAALEEHSESYSEHIFAIMIKARRLSEICKVPTTIDWINDAIDRGSHPVIFFNFADTLMAVYNKLIEEFPGLISRIVGGQSDKQRELEIAKFQADETVMTLANMNAGNACISLHDLHGNYPRESLLCPSWSAPMTLQALGRIFRAHGKTPCLQEFLFASEIEERQRIRVASKIANIGQLNDGDLSLIESIPLIDFSTMYEESLT